MSHDDVKPESEYWQELASRVSTETDPNKVVDLAKELIDALDKKSNKLLERVSVDSKTSGQGAA